MKVFLSLMVDPNNQSYLMEAQKGDGTVVNCVRDRVASQSAGKEDCIEKMKRCTCGHEGFRDPRLGERETLSRAHTKTVRKRQTRQETKAPPRRCAETARCCRIASGFVNFLLIVSTRTTFIEVRCRRAVRCAMDPSLVFGPFKSECGSGKRRRKAGAV